MIRAGEGRKRAEASSALMRHSNACPRGSTSSWAIESRSPAATRICSRTRSRPVTASVTVCSTWIRVFISRKKNSSPETRYSRVPAEVYPTACAARTDASPIRRRRSSDTTGLGVSSTSFWCRRCTEQSRSPSQTQLPWESARIWISTWRGSGR